MCCSPQWNDSQIKLLLYSYAFLFILQPHQSHDSGVSSSSSAPTPQQPRHQHDDITSLHTFRAILEHGASHSQDDASLKHQTSSQISQEESEEMSL